MPEKKLTVAIVGLGRAGHVHLRSLASLTTKARITWVVDINAETVARVAAQYECNGTTDLNEALDDTELDAVVVCSATFTHFDFTMRCLAAKKAVFTEKPISHDPAELEEVLELAIRSNLVFCTGYQRRCDKNFRALKQQLQNGSIGGMRLIKCTSRCTLLPFSVVAPRLCGVAARACQARTSPHVQRPSPVRFVVLRFVLCRDNPEPPIEYLKISGGIFHDMLCHDFDMIHFLTGEFPESVYSVGHCYNPQIEAMGDCDTVVVTLKFASGLLATVDTSRIACYGYDQRIEVLGSLGMAQANNAHENTVTVATAQGFLGAKSEFSFPERYVHTYLTEMDEFVEQARAGRPDPEEWTRRHVILEKVTTAAELSWRLNREVRIADVDGLRDKVPPSTLHGPMKTAKPATI